MKVLTWNYWDVAETMRNKIQNEPSFFFPVSALEFTTSSIMIGQFHSTMIARYINCDLLISFSPIQKQGRGKLNYHPIPFCFNSVRGSWGELNPSPLPAGGLAPHLSHCADRREGLGCKTGFLAWVPWCTIQLFGGAALWVEIKMPSHCLTVPPPAPLDWLDSAASSDTSHVS